MSGGWVARLPFPLIRSIAEAYHVDHRLVAAICQVESSGNPKAIRREPHWQYWHKPEEWARKFVDPKAAGLVATRPKEEQLAWAAAQLEAEKERQRHSYGLMQVMGAVCRELGYAHATMDLLFEPAIGIAYGCKVLQKLSKYTSVADKAAAYNAGLPRKDPNTGEYRNQKYVGKVLALLADFK